MNWAAHLFGAPEVVVEAFRRAAPDRLDEETAATVRGAARVANRRSVALVVGLALVPIAAAWMEAPVYIGAHVVVGVGIVIAVAWTSRTRSAPAPRRGRS